jgi:hypothetical protein
MINVTQYKTKRIDFFVFNSYTHKIERSVFLIITFRPNNLNEFNGYTMLV